jgi:two-component system, cell cycle sensor histidine kinase and response regulator CckA
MACSPVVQPRPGKFGTVYMRQENSAPVNQPPKVMIVEDEAIIARDIQTQLVRFGFAVTGTTTTAADAFRDIEENRPDIVLMDIRLGGEMDGVQAADIIRSRYALPVVYLTAHADEATLQRARVTEPFGFIVKPFSKANIKAALTMALYKHGVERELEDSRTLLSTILQGLADAVLVADPSGEILFLNRAAEQLTGWRHQDATGKSLLQIAPIHDGDARLISAELLQQAVAQGSPVRMPRGSALIGKDGNAIEISGQLAVTTVGSRAAGVFVTLQDATVQKREEQRLRQEQQMFVAGELAHGIAGEFYALFDLIENASDALVGSQFEGDAKRELDLIRQAGQIGAKMSTQLFELREGHGAGHVVNVNDYLVASRSILERLCGSGIQLDISSAPDAGYVISTGNHIEQLLLHLVLEGKQRVDGQGSLSIRADVHTQPISRWGSGSYVRLLVRAVPSSTPGASSQPFPFGTEPPALGLAVVRAIAIASEGFVRVTEPVELVSVMEVFLPRHEGQRAASAATNEYAEIILGIGLQVPFAESLRKAMGEDVLLLEATSLEDAALISEMYTGDIHLILLNTSLFPPKTKDRACDRIRARRPNVSFLEVASPSDPSGTDPVNADELERRLRDLLNRKSQRAIASAG